MIYIYILHIVAPLYIRLFFHLTLAPSRCFHYRRRRRRRRRRLVLYILYYIYAAIHRRSVGRRTRLVSSLLSLCIIIYGLIILYTYDYNNTIIHFIRRTRISLAPATAAVVPRALCDCFYKTISADKSPALARRNASPQNSTAPVLLCPP